MNRMSKWFLRYLYIYCHKRKIAMISVKYQKISQPVHTHVHIYIYIYIYINIYMMFYIKVQAF